MATKSNAEYKMDERDRKRARGMVPVQIWVHADDAQALKTYGAKLNNARVKAARAVPKDDFEKVKTKPKAKR